jgi:hypothetical protein
MAALTVAGSPIRVRKNTWKRLPSLYQGGDSRQDDMTVVSTIDPATEIRVAECEVFFTDDTTADAFEASIPRGDPVTIGGYLPGTGFTSAYIVIAGGTAIHYKIGGVAGVYRAFSLHLEQAEP